MKVKGRQRYDTRLKGSLKISLNVDTIKLRLISVDIACSKSLERIRAKFDSESQLCIRCGATRNCNGARMKLFSSFESKTDLARGRVVSRGVGS